jgi:hypothetical protein
MRNRRYVLRKGPLVVYGADHGISKAFRNLPGVEVASVDALNLLQLAPGGHLGRFVIFTKSAFDRLDKIFGEDVFVGGAGGVGEVQPGNGMCSSSSSSRRGFSCLAAGALHSGARG